MFLVNFGSAVIVKIMMKTACNKYINFNSTINELGIRKGFIIEKI